MTLPNEFRVLAAAVRTGLAANGGAGEQLPVDQVDWPRVIGAARAHRVIWFLSNAGLAMPDESRVRLTRLTHQSALSNLLRVRASARVLALLGEQGIRCLIIKGVVLSQQLYGDPTRRGGGDVDVLVDPARFLDADQCLRDAGYQPSGLRLTHLPSDPAMLARIRDLQYRDGDGHLIELHQRLTDNPRRLESDFETLWAERAQVWIGQACFPTLSVRFLSLYLCVHGAHHCWERLCWLADVAVLARGRVEECLADADAAGLGKPMRLALALTHHLLNSPDWQPGVREQRAASAFMAAFFTGQQGLGPVPRGSPIWVWRGIRRRLFLYGLRSSWGYRWGELVSDLTNPIELQSLALPPRLMFLYPLLRPLGWLIRNFWRWRGRGF